MTDYAYGYCGMPCALCSRYRTDGKSRCTGCSHGGYYTDVCKVYACCRGREIGHCGECGEFPCARLGKMGEFSNLRTNHVKERTCAAVASSGFEGWYNEYSQRARLLTAALADYNDGRMKRYLCELFICADMSDLREIMRKAEKLSGSPKEKGRAFRLIADSADVFNEKRESGSMELKLIKASWEYKKQICDMLDEWYASGEDIVPYVITKADYYDFDNYLENLEIKNAEGGLVPDSTFFCLDTDRNIVVGAVNIRHYLNERLLRDGGHIGDGVRPSERRKGIATRMIALALAECKKLGIEKVLMVCSKANTASAKSIINNGGVLENEIISDGETEQRYWIDNV